MTWSKHDLVEILGAVLFAILNEHIAVVVRYRGNITTIGCLITPITISVLQVVVLEGSIRKNSASVSCMVIS